MSDTLINEIIGGKYIIKASLGRGGTGEVYLAKKLNTNDLYAIKTISTEDRNALKLLERETETLKRLNHPSIVKFIENGYEESHHLVYLVLEYLEGEDIQSYFDNGTNLKTKIDLFLQMIDAVSHSHSKDVIHRDIKPDNIKVVDNDEQPVAKILDFGIAIITTTILTNTIRSYYTPLFAPPEQIECRGVSRESDIYSLAMTFLYLLSADEAITQFREEQNKNILYESALDSLTASESLKDSLGQVLKRAINEKREERPRIDELRKVFSILKEELSEKLPVIFRVTDSLKKKISDLNRLENQPFKLKIYLQDKLTNNSSIVHIQKIKGRENNPNRLTVEIGVETTSYIVRGFTELDNPNKIVLFDELQFYNPQSSEKLFENGVEVKIDPIIEVGGNPRNDSRYDLSDLINKLQQQERLISNEIESKKEVDAMFSQWQNVIDLETKIIAEKKQSFPYSSYEYDRENQKLIISLKQPISLEELEKITSPPLPVTISVKKQSPPYSQRQRSVGDIVDGEKSKNGEVEKLHVSIGDFCNPDLLEFIADGGRIEKDLKAQESEIGRRKKALRAIRYGDAENSNLAQIISEPSRANSVEPLRIDRFFDGQLDDSQKEAVCKALATEDIFLIQGPPGTGKTSVITEIVLQILKKYPQDKILISSQSNIAVDNVLTRLSQVQLQERTIKLLRIGREERIEEEVKQFEIEKAITNWQESIRNKSLDNWQVYEEEHQEVLQGAKKISDIDSIKTLRQEAIEISQNIKEAVDRLNSDLIITTGELLSNFAADEVLEHIYQKLSLEPKLLEKIRKYVEKYSLEYPENKQLSEWIQQEYDRLQAVLGENNQNYESFLQLKKLKDEWNERLKRQQRDLLPIFLDEVNVVGATCIGVANLKDFNFDWAIVDEAGRSTAPETFVPMARGKKIILVGDHKQLPPIIKRELAEQALIEQKLEKRVLETSLFEYLYQELPRANKIALKHQYRMHPDIGNLVSSLFYEKDISSDRVFIDDKLHKLNGFDKNVYWITTSDVKQKEKIYERESGTSYTNGYEATLIKAVLEKIQRDCQSSGLHKEVGIITGYARQIGRIEAAVTPKDNNLWTNLHIVVHTVDAFQGRECDIIIYDLVRSNKQKKLGFTSDDRRLNVALSRAKELLIIVGNDVMAYRGRPPKGVSNPFQPLIEYIDRNSDVCNRVVSRDFLTSNMEESND